MKTIADLHNLIAANLNSTNEQLSGHAGTLLGPRTRGSTTEYGLDELPLDREIFPVYECSAVSDGVDAYWCKANELKPRLGAVELGHCIETRQAVHVREGSHGTELYLDVPPKDCNMPATDYITILVGDCAGERAVFTWHPGQPLPPVSEGLKWNTAVKRHNGDE